MTVWSVTRQSEGLSSRGRKTVVQGPTGSGGGWTGTTETRKGRAVGYTGNILCLVPYGELDYRRPRPTTVGRSRVRYGTTGLGSRS